MFRKSVSDPNLIFNKLPVALYPEYHAVHRMMASGRDQQRRVLKDHTGYTAWAQTEILEITRDRKVWLKGPENTEMIQVVQKMQRFKDSPSSLPFSRCPIFWFLSEHLQT